MITTDLFESQQLCPECGGPAFSDLVLAEKKDACYSKVRSRYKVWPSAYASGALVQCRKKGAANWGNKSESVAEGSDMCHVCGQTPCNCTYITENHDNGEYSDEAGMAHGNLITIARAARGLLDTIDQHEDLPEWVQEKIAKVEGMLVSAWNYLQSQEAQGIDPRITEVYGTLAEAWSHVRHRMELVEEFDIIERVVEGLAVHNGVDQEVIWEDLESLTDDELYVFAVTTPIMEDWQKANKRDKTDGMSRKAVKAYRREHPGSKLQTAVTTKPSKLKKGSKASKRRKSYCSRSRGQMKMHSISCSKTPDKAICKARRRWNCESMEYSGTMVAEVDMTRRGFLRGLGAAIGAAAAGNALAGANEPGFMAKVQDAHYDLVDKNPRYAKEHAALQLPVARGITGNALAMNKRWAEKTAELLQKYGVAINEGIGQKSSDGRFTLKYDASEAFTIWHDSQMDLFVVVGKGPFKDKIKQKGFDIWGDAISYGEQASDNYDLEQARKAMAAGQDVPNNPWADDENEVSMVGGRVVGRKPGQRVAEAGSPAQQAAIAIAMKKAHKKPKTEGVEEAFIAPALSAANANAEHRRQGAAGGGYRGRIDIPVQSREDYRAAGLALKKAAAAAGQKIEYGLSNGVMSVFSDSMDADALDQFIDHALGQGLEEMDKSQPSHGRDGHVSHSTYGSRDRGGSQGQDRTARMTTADRMMRDAEKKFLKHMSNADKVKKGWRNPNIDEGYNTEELANEVYAEFERTYPNLARRADERTIHAAIMDVLNYGGDNDAGALAQDVARAVKQQMQQGVAEGVDNLLRKYYRNENDNLHSENVVLLAQHFGTPSELRMAKQALAYRNEQGGFDYSDPKAKKYLMFQQEINKKYYPLLKRQGVAEVSDATLISYLSKVDADSQKHPMDPSKRSPDKRSRSVGGFARAFNKLDARKEKTDEVKQKAVPGSQRDPGALATRSHIASQEKAHSDWAERQKKLADDFYKNHPELDDRPKSVATENSMADELAKIAMKIAPRALVRKDGETLQSPAHSPKPAGTTAPRPAPKFDPEAEYSDDYRAWHRRTKGLSEGISIAEAWARRYPNLHADIAECKTAGDGERLKRLMAIKNIIDSELGEQAGLGFGQ